MGCNKDLLEGRKGHFLISYLDKMFLLSLCLIIHMFSNWFIGQSQVY